LFDLFSVPTSVLCSLIFAVIVDESASFAPASGEIATPVTAPAIDSMQLDAIPALTIQNDQLSAAVIVNESASSAPASGEIAMSVTTPAKDSIQLDAVPALTVQNDQPLATSLESSPIPTATAIPSGINHPDNQARITTHLHDRTNW
jgi:hypothetical protein